MFLMSRIAFFFLTPPPLPAWVSSLVYQEPLQFPEIFYIFELTSPGIPNLAYHTTLELQLLLLYLIGPYNDILNMWRLVKIANHC